MKKVVYALAALSMVALMGLTSCSKEPTPTPTPETSPYSEILAMGKYVGMQRTVVDSLLQAAGWSHQELFMWDEYTKTINGFSVKMQAITKSGNYVNFNTSIPDTAYYNSAKVAINQVGMEFKFETCGTTATFEKFYGYKSDQQVVSSSDYTTAMNQMNTSTDYIDIKSQWNDGSGHTLEIKTYSDLTHFDIDFGETVF